MAMTGAALAETLSAALTNLALPGGVHHGAAQGAAFPHAVVEIGPESDWSCKDRAGREVRIAVTIADKGPSAARLHALMGAAEAAILASPAMLADWEIVTLRFLRSRVVRSGTGWTGLAEFRARLLELAR
ncbi:DUF3168 domain-containing protein [Allosphingosinicella flava]|uniref:DUF3168 domain-containing protein n=1 Tax=Allosphingosinicella flava TaxID=2771430 RepID=A0A7T2LMZ1_9SPHN|nr:DUF3168 domain-containing protein [Sphingosinicella flava]QPQ56079.1 DUF3168 domain-containing protein [Sphingosinicella flava]